MSYIRFGLLIVFLMILVSSSLSQDVTFSNELPGFEFYGKGKLKGIALKNSTRQDVIAAFGDDCDMKYCKYDEEWNVAVFYLEEHWRETKVDEKYEYTLAPSADFVGRVWILLFEPRRIVSLKDFQFPTSFVVSQSTMFHSGSELLDYRHDNRLMYSLLNEGADKGNLVSINYSLPESATVDSFVEVGVKDRELPRH